MKLLSAGDRDVTAVQFAPDGRALLAYCFLGVPLLWDVPLGADPRPVATGPMGGWEFTFSPDGGVIGWLCNGVRLEFDLQTRALRKSGLVPVGEHVRAQAACGERLVFSTYHELEGARVRAFDARSEAEAWAFGSDPGRWALALAATGADRVFAFEAPLVPKSVERWFVSRATAAGEVLASAPVPVPYLQGLSAARDAALVVGFSGSSLVAWRPGERARKVRTDARSHYRALAFHPDGRHLLTGNNDGAARLLDTQTWRTVRRYDWRIGKVSAVGVNPDGALAAAGGERGRVVVWDLDV